MRIDQLRYLTEIEKSHSMHSTSEKMHISPQALSAAIKSLESELDLVLLERSFQGTQLTPIGEKISNVSSRFLTELDQILEDYHKPNNTRDKFDLYIFPHDDMDNFMSKLATEFLHRQIDAAIHIGEYSEEEIFTALDENQSQIALGYVYKLDDKLLLNQYKDYVCEPLCSMRYCCRVSNKSSLNQYMSVSLKTILKYTIVHTSSQNSDIFIDLIYALTRQPDILVCKKQSVYQELLSSGNNMISLVVDIPYKDRGFIEYVPGTIEIPIKENLQRELCLIYKKDTVFTEKTQAIIKILKNYITYTIRNS